MKTHIRTAVGLFLVLTVITGVLYPLVVTGIAHTYLRQRPTEA
jgi:K+-transporting ATPase c subunit